MKNTVLWILYLCTQRKIQDYKCLFVITITTTLIKLKLLIEKFCVCFFLDPASVSGRENVIQIHPDFRMIVLANRPGFPFLGNDFFGTLGKLSTL